MTAGLLGVVIGMASEEAFPFELDEASGVPIWVQLRNRLMFLIDSGYYVDGDRLPTVRALAAQLSVNYHTVNKVYTTLEYEGYISSKRGRGAFVCKQSGAHTPDLPGNAVLNDCIRQCLELGMGIDDIEAHFLQAIEGFRSGGPGDRT